MEYITAKTIVSRTKNTSWFGTDYNMNIYKGCSHGCIYCDSRSDCYRVSNFDQVKAKENALIIIRDELRRKIKAGVVGTGSMSDPYNPHEKELCLTRHALELIEVYGYGVAIATKSELITRDMDILKCIQDHAPVICKITITTPDDELSKVIEPGVCPSSNRFAAIKRLSDEGIYAGILLMPILPFITDKEDKILEIIKQAKENGARFIYPEFGVTLRSNQRDYYYDKLDTHFPHIKEEYIKKYGDSYRCGIPSYNKLYRIFANECERVGLLYKMHDIIDSYKSGYEYEQLTLF